jgi:ADP-ribose pyrophosphatase YjhB (NUDIX family)
MRKAARAIIIEDGKILVMFRKKQGSKYFTLVGGRVYDNESIEHGLIREIKEETGLDITNSRLVFFEEHPEPYNEQYIYLCEVGPHDKVQIQDGTEEATMNRLEIDVHQPVWAETSSFARLPFRTPQLQDAIVEGLKIGFPDEPVRI